MNWDGTERRGEVKDEVARLKADTAITDIRDHIQECVDLRREIRGAFKSLDNKLLTALAALLAVFAALWARGQGWLP